MSLPLPNPSTSPNWLTEPTKSPISQPPERFPGLASSLTLSLTETTPPGRRNRGTFHRTQEPSRGSLVLARPTDPGDPGDIDDWARKTNEGVKRRLCFLVISQLNTQESCLRITQATREPPTPSSDHPDREGPREGSPSFVPPRLILHGTLGVLEDPCHSRKSNPLSPF